MYVGALSELDSQVLQQRNPAASELPGSLCFRLRLRVVGNLAVLSIGFNRPAVKICGKLIRVRSLPANPLRQRDETALHRCAKLPTIPSFTRGL